MASRAHRGIWSSPPFPLRNAPVFACLSCREKNCCWPPLLATAYEKVGPPPSSGTADPHGARSEKKEGKRVEGRGSGERDGGTTRGYRSCPPLRGEVPVRAGARWGRINEERMRTPRCAAPKPVQNPSAYETWYSKREKKKRGKREKKVSLQSSYHWKKKRALTVGKRKAKQTRQRTKKKKKKWAHPRKRSFQGGGRYSYASDAGNPQHRW